MENKYRLRYEIEMKQWWIDITDFAKDFFGDVISKVELSAFHSYSTENEAIAKVDDVILELQNEMKRKEIIIQQSYLAERH